MRLFVRTAVAVACAMIALAAPACGKSKSSTGSTGLPGKAVKPLSADLVPSDVLGLQTSQEDITKALAGGRRSYVQSTSVYSFRKDNLLQATVWRADYSPRATITTALDPERLRQATGGIVEPSAWRSAGPSR